MNIGIDLDDVFADFMTALIEYHNATHNTSLTKQQFKTYRFWETWGGTREEAIQEVYNFHKTPYYENIKPIEGTQEAIKILKENNKLFIITSRQDCVIEQTKKWIEKHFPNTFAEIYFTNHYSQNGNPTRTKKEICDEIGIDILIEDSLDYAKECINPNRQIFLINAPWNQTEEKLPKEIIRVNN